ncbi:MULTISPECIES: M50 family metallopeptidase [Niallia]|uniref:M50 family peptidase n=1 Tax=Niallia taxi TaxID=2499688 RepID=A0A437K7J2_9BACI|nr:MULTISPECIES: M50 family metallopeptidase [Niallia]MDK8642436.1 M50 family metallopeptidase [Niallia taxi]MED4040586.1 M50 family metallopeptidase [Niallia taxi]MED4057026.1 M50 family metallopeptidase [Niallia taxi]MED4121628.1 M50 family metallopeptidase [Niallia taxi]RVT59537.1 M50 family peptidase [Niallia taxi]
MTPLSFFIYVLIAVLITNVPLVGKYVSVIATLVHEIGHGIAAILCGGRLKQIHLYANTEGMALTTHTDWFSKFITTLAGYIFTSAFGLFSIWMISKDATKLLIFTYLAFLVLTLLLWIRNFYGFIWIISFGSLFLLLLVYSTDFYQEQIIYLITCIIFTESIKSACIIMYLSFKYPHDAGDATSLKEIIKVIPASIWGILFFVQSLYFGWQGIRLILNQV